MSLFDEQIRTRKTADEGVYTDAFARMASVLMGASAELGGVDDAGCQAVAEVLRYFGIKPQPIPRDITDYEDQTEFLLRPSGIMRRHVVLPRHWYKDASGPMVGRMKADGTRVAFLPHPVKGYVYVDPSGHRTRITPANEGLFEEEAVLFYKPLPQHSLTFKDVFVYIHRAHLPSDTAFFLIFLLFATATQYLVPRLTKLISARLFYSNDMKLFWTVAFCLVSLSISQALFTGLKNLCLSRINNRSCASFEAAVVMRLLMLPADFFRAESAGKLTSRLYSSPRMLPMNINNLIYSTIFTTAFSMVYLLQIGQYAPALAPIAVMTVLLQLAVYIAGSVVKVGVTKQQLVLDAADSSMSFNIFYGIQKIKLAGAEKRIFSQWARNYAPAAKVQYDPPVFLILFPAIATGIGLLGQVAIYRAGLENGITLSDYYAFSSAYGFVQAAVFSMNTLAQTIAQISPQYDRLRPLLEAVPETSEMRKVVAELDGRIELNDVCFTYDPALPNVVDHMNLTIAPGEYLAIVGKTGCGKSSLMRLLLGFETPQSGQITYDGHNIDSLDLRSLRRKIGVVLQDGRLFQGDIYSNIVISAPWLTEEDAWQAAEMAGLADDIRRMPMGMHTMINANGGGVSGGQRQRIMIARAIAAKPRVLMLDEATSALDNMTQKIVSDSLEGLHCTRIVIAHRLSTIRQCDRIIMLDKGHIVESGTYDELIAADGAFADMVRRQQVSYNPED